MKNGDLFDGWKQALEAGELRFPRCDDCGRWNWYPSPRCRSCGGRSMSWLPVAPRGTLYSWTRVHRSFASGRSIATPYVTGIVEMVEAPGVRLVCLQRAGDGAPRIGAAVELTLGGDEEAPAWTFAEHSPPG